MRIAENGRICGAQPVRYEEPPVPQVLTVLRTLRPALLPRQQ